MVRFGAVLKLKPGAYEKYKTFHASVWPEVLAAIRNSNIRNYSIHFKDGWLFSYYEYEGGNYQADMARMAQDPKIREWWAIMEPLQDPLSTRKPGEWWAGMEELFHID